MPVARRHFLGFNAEPGLKLDLLQLCTPKMCHANYGLAKTRLRVL